MYEKEKGTSHEARKSEKREENKCKTIFPHIGRLCQGR